MKANVKARGDEQANFGITHLLGAVLVIVLFAAVVGIVSSQLNTARLNTSVKDLGVDGFMSIIAVVFVIIVIYGLYKHYGES